MLQIIELPGGYKLVVETEGTEDLIPDDVLQSLPPNGSDNTRPDGAEPVSARSHIRNAGILLHDQISALGALAEKAIESVRSDEVVISAHIKFGGDLNIIPFIAKGSGEGGLQLTMKWKRDQSQ